jgi:acyl-CoA thioesterase-1
MAFWMTGSIPSYAPRHPLASFALVAIALAALACDSRPEPAPSTATAPSATPSARPEGDPAPAPQPAARVERPKIVCLGDSLTAGFGLPRAANFPARLQEKLDEDGYVYEVVNAGVSGDTSAGGARRVAKALEGNVDVLVVELGGNDGLRGLPPDQLKQNLTDIVRAGKAKGAKVLLAGMEAPPNLGPDYTARFRSVYAEVSREQDVPLVPFFLEGVAGRLEYNQPDAIHPNEAGVAIVTELVYDHLEPLLEKP